MTAIAGGAPGSNLVLWRDPDQDILPEPGVAMDPLLASGDPIQLAAKLYADGVRRVALDQPVDLTGTMQPTSLVWTMLLLRELTSWGLVVDWQLRVGRFTQIWQRLNHLYPPSEIVDQPDSETVLADWRGTFYLCKCVYRFGPGFAEVRDRRNGVLSRFVIDAPDYLAAMRLLVDGTTKSEVPGHVLADLVDEGLAGVADDLAWWLPYRVHRWPWPAMIV